MVVHQELVHFVCSTSLLSSFVFFTDEGNLSEELVNEVIRFNRIINVLSVKSVKK